MVLDATYISAKKTRSIHETVMCGNKWFCFSVKNQVTCLPLNNFTVNMMEHYDRIRPGSKIAWPKCNCKLELKIGWRNRIIIKKCCRL